MLTLYCDASGKETAPAIAVGGFVSTREQWLQFDCKLAAVLKHFGLEYFHMREFAPSVGQFARWKGEESKRRAFLDQFIEVIVNHATFWTASYVRRNVYLGVDAEYKLHEFLYPYPLCARTCVNTVYNWRDAQRLGDMQLECVFETGDEHFGQLSGRLVAETGVSPITRTKFQATPLQAADFAAWEVLKAYRMFSLETAQLFGRFRTSFLRLTTIPCQWGEYDEQNLRLLCRRHKIERR